MLRVRYGLPMLINDFEEKVDVVRRYRAGGAQQPARVAKALGAGYRVTLPLDGTSAMFHLKPSELPRLLAEFPGVTELWRLFVVT
jgi:hypothetical protein